MTQRELFDGGQPAARCRGCGKQILWIEFDGRNIPLDAVAPCYVRMADKESGAEVWARGHQAFVSHFATCSQANRFSGGNRRG